MPHETGLITTIVAGLVLAFIFGAIANRFRLPPLVGYLIAGVLVGPYTPGFVADGSIASQLAEIGVILLMFGVGLHFSLKDLLSVRAVAIPGALVQIGFATFLGWGLSTLMGWPLGGGLVFGLALSVASTVVLLKALQERRLIETERGRIAVGWLIVEDLAMVLALVLIPALAGLFNGGEEVIHVVDPFVSLVERLIGGDVGIWGVLGLTVLKLVAFVGVMLVVGRRVIPFVLHYTAHTGSRELFRLAVLAIALGVAAGASYLFGVSLALGAFFAGMILSESELSHRAAQESLPLRDAFAVLFFVSVGMLFDPTILLRDPWPVLATVLIIIFGKSIAAFLIVVAFKRPISTALIISASLAQIGEFSFILAELGVGLNLLPEAGRDLILAGAIISIILNPIVFWGIDRLKPFLESKSAARGIEAAPHLEPSAEGEVAVDAPMGDAIPASVAEDDVAHPTALSGHIVLIGYGRVGRVVAEGLLEAKVPFLIVEDADSRIAAARARGIEIVVGNAAARDVLIIANVAAARTMLVAIPDGYEGGNVTEQARKLNPTIRIIARAHSEEEEEHLEHLGADTVIMGEREIGLGMLSMLISGQSAAAGQEPAEPVVDAPLPGPRLMPAENLVAGSIPPVIAAALPSQAAIDMIVIPPETAPVEDNLESIGLEPQASSAGNSPEVAPRAPESERLAPEPVVDAAASEPVAVADDVEPVTPSSEIEPIAAVESALSDYTPVEEVGPAAVVAEPVSEALIEHDAEVAFEQAHLPLEPVIVAPEPAAPVATRAEDLEHAAMAAIESNGGAHASEVEDWLYAEALPVAGTPAEIETGLQPQGPALPDLVEEVSPVERTAPDAPDAAAGAPALPEGPDASPESNDDASEPVDAPAIVPPVTPEQR